MLLTDDGTFAHEILAPKRHVSKTYTVVLDTPLTEEMRAELADIQASINSGDITIENKMLHK